MPRTKRRTSGSRARPARWTKPARTSRSTWARASATDGLSESATSWSRRCRTADATIRISPTFLRPAVASGPARSLTRRSQAAYATSSHGQLAGSEEVIDRRGHAFGRQRGRRHTVRRHRQPRAVAQLALGAPHRRCRGQQEQPAHATADDSALQIIVREHPQRDAVVVVEQRRIAPHRHSAAARLDDLRDRADVPRDDAPALLDRRRRRERLSAPRSPSGCGSP